MWLYYSSVILAIIANVGYYYFQKTTPSNVNPVLSLAVTYFTAMVTCLLILPFYTGKENFFIEIKKLNWSGIMLGVTIVGLEMGFLLAFRTGWNISVAGIFVNAIVALILVPVGVIVFKERLNIINILGILLCIAGLALAARK